MGMRGRCGESEKASPPVRRTGGLALPLLLKWDFDELINRVFGEQLVAVLGDDDILLQAHAVVAAPLAGPVLDGDDHAGL